MFRWLAVLLCVVCAGGISAQAVSYGRVSRTEGDVYVLKFGSDEWEYGTVNLLIEEGDIIRTNGHDFTEVELENGTRISLDQGTKVRMLYLARDTDYAEWTNEIELVYGTVRVSTPETPGWESELTVQTPTGLVRVGEECQVKVMVGRSGASKIIAYTGTVIVEGEWDELFLGPGEVVWINSRGELELPARVHVEREDRFDRWCGSCCYTYCESRKYVHTDICIGVAVLDAYGDWVWYVDYGWVWRPCVTVGWCPYRHGRWIWSGRFGWFWASYEPWGWVPFHYGRWAYSPIYGWVWIPGTIWGPGWVTWAWGPGWIGWAPLGPGDCPALSVGHAYTSVSRESFFSKPKRPTKEAGYPQYLDVKIDKGSWSRELPEQIAQGTRTRTAMDERRYREMDKRKVEQPAREASDYLERTERKARVEQEPRVVPDYSEEVRAKGESIQRKRVYDRPEERKTSGQFIERTDDEKVVEQPRRRVSEEKRPSISARMQGDSERRESLRPSRNRKETERSPAPASEEGKPAVSGRKEVGPRTQSPPPSQNESAPERAAPPSSEQRRPSVSPKRQVNQERRGTVASERQK